MRDVGVREIRRVVCSGPVELGHRPDKHRLEPDGLQVMDPGSILSGGSLSQPLDYSVPWSCL